MTICPVDAPFGVSWGTDGIVFGQGNKGIMRVSPNGGTPERLVSVNTGEFAQSPQMLPGGEAVLFTLGTGTTVDEWDRAQGFVTRDTTVYAIQDGRGFAQAATVLGAAYAGVLQRDGWAPYRKFVHAGHQTCLAHLLRRCRTMMLDHPHHPFASQVNTLLRAARATRDRHRDGDVSHQGLAIARGHYSNRLGRLLDRRPSRLAEARRFNQLLRYTDPLNRDLPTTNYQRQVLHDDAEWQWLVKHVCLAAADQCLVIVAKHRLACQDHNGCRDAAWALAQPRKQIDPGLLTEIEVQDDRAEMVLFGGRHRFGDRGRLQGCESIQMKQAGKNASDAGVVVYHQYVAVSFGALHAPQGRQAPGHEPSDLACQVVAVEG